MNHLCLVTVPLLLFGLFNATGKNVVVTKAQHQSKIKVLKNTEFQVLLDSNPTTGFSWRVLSFDSTILQMKKEEFLADKSAEDRVGAGGKQIFKFKTIANGTTDLQLIYQRPWEKDTSRADRFRVKIVVPK
jgi:inhibitor of cysteine peptidase